MRGRGPTSTSADPVAPRALVGALALRAWDARSRKRVRAMFFENCKRLAGDGHGVLEYACDPVEDAQARVSAAKTAGEIARRRV
jgi:hypothetical protein